MHNETIKKPKTLVTFTNLQKMEVYCIIYLIKQLKGRCIVVLGYARVSIDNQSLDRQIDELNRCKTDEIFTKNISGAKTKDLSLAGF
ncbi:MAG: recombinase family protein [Oscillospiraceae bacterium]|nr:recombinase family protein [Oscillospiraceae bacterium]